MSDDELIAEIADAHKAVSRMIIDGTLAGWTDSAHAAHHDRATLLRMLDKERAKCRMATELAASGIAVEAQLRKALKTAAHFMRNCGIDLERNYPEIAAALAPEVRAMNEDTGANGEPGYRPKGEFWLVNP